jgi:hypothetical protein
MSLTLDIEIVSAFLLEFDFSWMWDQLHWNFISSSFCAYVECPNLIWYVSCTSIFSRDGHVLQVGLEVRLWNSELDWISTLMCASPCLLLMQFLVRARTREYFREDDQRATPWLAHTF